jgi:O-succinylbenzoate synthase
MICRFAFRRYRLPFRSPIATAHGAWNTREGILLRLETEGGLVGWGEAAPVPGFRMETVEQVAARCREAGDSVDLGRSIQGPASFRRALDEARYDLEPSPAVAARPSSLAVARLLPAGRAALAAVAPAGEVGFRVFKWKVGVGEIGDEIALLDDLCAALPSAARLRLDANGAWDRRRAERWLDRCADRPIEFVEQPVSPTAAGADDLLRGLAEDYPTPLALDESIASDGAVERWIGAGWPGFYIVKPSLAGDLGEDLSRLKRAGATVIFSSAFETAIGIRAALRVAFDWPGPSRAIGFGAGPLFADSRFDGPALAPFLRWDDVLRLNPETIWSALN